MAELVERYEAGESASVLARSRGVSVWSVITRLRKAGIRIRSAEQQNRLQLDLSQENLEVFLSLVDGLMLGDGWIDRKGLLRLEQCSRRLGWVEQVQDALAGVGADSRIVPIPPRVRKIGGREVRSGGGHLLYTPAYAELKPQRRRWYPEGDKRVPADVRLTPLSLSHWFAGDGTSHEHGHLFFCTDGFPRQDVELLICALQGQVGIEARVKRTSRPGQFWVAIYKLDEAVKLRELIEPHLAECFSYKLRYVRPFIGRRGSGRLTDDQVREIRSRREAGELLRVLAGEFGLGESHVCAIAKGRSYAHVSDVLEGGVEAFPGFEVSFAEMANTTRRLKKRWGMDGDGD